jgi:diphosphomevalonate decarboxylase
LKKLAHIRWKSPSNIAIIKYWGKTGDQYPKNPSLSMTLDTCHTITDVCLFEKKLKNDKIDFSFTFEGRSVPHFTDRISKYFLAVSERLSILKKFRIEINSQNSFPHSAGIASSASSMSALALCLASLEKELGNLPPHLDFFTHAAILARLASGSATRSLYGEFAIWGNIELIPGTSDEFSVPLPFHVHNIFSQLRDTILVIDQAEKKVSSSAGHSLMDGHPYADQRFINARTNLGQVLDVLKAGDFDNFVRILEHEALSLHALMLTARPWYSLLSPNTLIALERIKNFRETTRCPIAFTLDAGPNVHIIYPISEEIKVKAFINQKLSDLCENGKIISDHIGNGPELLVENFFDVD